MSATGRAPSAGRRSPPPASASRSSRPANRPTTSIPLTPPIAPAPRRPACGPALSSPGRAPGRPTRRGGRPLATVRLGGNDLIPALDIEVTGGLTPSALTSWVTAWLGEASARLGVKPMIYTSPAFWKKYLADTRSLADAGYKVLGRPRASPSRPCRPRTGAATADLWQYDNCGNVSGIPGRVDLDRYHGADPRGPGLFELRPGRPFDRRRQAGRGRRGDDRHRPDQLRRGGRAERRRPSRGDDRDAQPVHDDRRHGGPPSRDGKSG